MNKEIRRSIPGMMVSLLLVLGAGPARALDVLTFDIHNSDRNEVKGALGFSVTHAGSNALSGLDFSLFDFIYVSPTLDQAGLQAFLGMRAGDLDGFLASGGSLVFGSPSTGGDANFGFNGFLPYPSLPSIDPIQEPGIQEPPAKVVSAVPEPGTLALFGLGMAGLLFYRRKPKSQA